MTTLYRLDLYNTSGALQYQVTDFLTLAYVKRVNSPGNIQFTVNGGHDLVSNINKKWQVEIWRKPSGQDWAREITGLYRMGTWYRTDDSKFVVYCPGLMSMLGFATVAWSAGYADRSSFTSDPAETIMKTLVTYNATTSATTGNGRTRTHTQSLFTGLTVQADGTNGNTLNWYCANENLLETLQKLAKIAGGDFDLVKTSSTAWQFRYYDGQLGTDRTATVTFAMDLGNMGNPVFTDDETGEATAAIVGGQGEGADRTYVIRTGTNYAAANDIEMFVNASDVDNTAGLQARGDQKLAEVEAAPKFEFDVLQSPQTLYGVHYGLGDLVTAINPLTGTSYTRKVEAVTVITRDSGEENISIDLAVVL